MFLVARQFWFGLQVVCFYKLFQVINLFIVDRSEQDKPHILKWPLWNNMKKNAALNFSSNAQHIWYTIDASGNVRRWKSGNLYDIWNGKNSNKFRTKKKERTTTKKSQFHWKCMACSRVNSTWLKNVSIISLWYREYGNVLDIDGLVLGEFFVVSLILVAFKVAILFVFIIVAICISNLFIKS